MNDINKNIIQLYQESKSEIECGLNQQYMHQILCNPSVWKTLKLISQGEYSK